MMKLVIDLCVGFLTGGLLISTAWGFFWLAISLVGLSRGTCRGRIVLKSLVGGVVPFSLVVALMWWIGGIEHITLSFGVGLVGVPMVLSGLWLRKMSDGQRAGTHLIAGIRHLMSEILGSHQGCSGCHHDHETCR
jgi:hypothetical protein